MRYLTPGFAAKMLGVARRTVQYWLERHEVDDVIEADDGRVRIAPEDAWRKAAAIERRPGRKSKGSSP